MTAAHQPPDATEWDARYAGDGQGGHRWSGRANGALVAEVGDLSPRTALDVGCGEGGDAVWLARRGWRVTALEPSRVALDRARRAAADAGVDVTWVHAGLLDAPGGTGVHDLVSVQYPAIHKTDAAVAAILGAVAPGGILLVVHHLVEMAGPNEHGFDPHDYVMPADVAARLDDWWTVEVDETRLRAGPVPDGARHVHDLVLRARRTASR